MTTRTSQIEPIDSAIQIKASQMGITLRRLMDGLYSVQRSLDPTTLAYWGHSEEFVVRRTHRNRSRTLYRGKSLERALLAAKGLVAP